jgi:hypothetical protein
MNSLFKRWLTEAINHQLITQMYRKQFPSATDDQIREKIELVSLADPTQNKKYSNWIFREFIKGNIRLPEDQDVVLNNLSFFEKINQH